MRRSPVSVSEARAELIGRVLPEGVPRLWCPMISHYSEDGGFDRARTMAHFKRLAPRVKGFLLPGSTGDGWEMEDREIRALLEIALAAAKEFRFRILIGVLKTEVSEVKTTIEDLTGWLCERTGCADAVDAMVSARVCGFTVCPPKGAERSQEEIRSALAEILSMGRPTSLYQLPQVTLNEMAPGTVAGLAREFSNLILFKDTSGQDRVALSQAEFGGVFMVRGAEGKYTNWPRLNGGVYDGFLLSTANSFPEELAGVLELLVAGRVADAVALSDRLDAIVGGVFEAVGGLEFGNAFANANKAMDHVRAIGGTAGEIPGPRTHSGKRLPVEVMREVVRLMDDAGCCPEVGYLR